MKYWHPQPMRDADDDLEYGIYGATLALNCASYLKHEHMQGKGTYCINH
jgi:hypothetical protein